MENNEQEKPTPFLKRVNDMEKKLDYLEEELKRVSTQVEIVKRSLRR